MRRKLGIAAFLALIGVVTLRFLRGRRPEATGEPASDPRAEELRRTLEEARRAAPTAVAPAPPDGPVAPPVEEPAPSAPVDVDAERRRVHEQARRAVEEMQADGDPPPA